MKESLQVVDTILERTNLDTMKESVNKSALRMFKQMGMHMDNPEDMNFVRKGVVCTGKGLLAEFSAC